MGNRKKTYIEKFVNETERQKKIRNIRQNMQRVQNQMNRVNRIIQHPLLPLDNHAWRMALATQRELLRALERLINQHNRLVPIFTTGA